MIRVDHATVRRRSVLHRPVALAAVEAVCVCGFTVEVNEPVVLPVQLVVQDPDGSRHVELSGAEWVCQRPLHGGRS